LAAVLAAAGYDVLVIDLDPRATATAELGVVKPTFTVNDLLYVDPTDDDPPHIRGLAADAILPAGPDWPDNLYVLAAERALGHRESDPTPGIEQRLAVALDGVADRYAAVLIDVPPRPGGKLAAAAIWAATHAVIPSTLDEDGYIGARDAITTIRRTRRTAGLQDLPLVGVLRHIVDRRRTELAVTYDAKLAADLPPYNGRSLLIPDVAVPKYVVRQESRALCVPITAASSPEAMAVRNAYTRVLNLISKEAA
jgi:chromosome partitioning protein